VSDFILFWRIRVQVADLSEVFKESRNSVDNFVDRTTLLAAKP